VRLVVDPTVLLVPNLFGGRSRGVCHARNLTIGAFSYAVWATTPQYLSSPELFGCAQMRDVGASPVRATHFYSSGVVLDGVGTKSETR
jgi:hypothetical protein